MALLTVSVGGASVVRGANGAYAPTRAEVELASVHAVVGDLHDQFFRAVDEAQVYRGAWDSALKAATDAAQKKQLTLKNVGTPNLSGSDAGSEFDRAYKQLDQAVSGRLSSDELGQAAIVGALSSVHENHTYYLPPTRWDNRSQTSTQYAGIGITLASYNNAFWVQQVYQGTPAEESGLRPGDRIIAIDGVSVAGIKMDDLTMKVRGADASTFVMTVQRKDGWSDVTLTRRKIVLSAFSAEIRDGNVGYIRLTSFPPANAKLPSGKTVPEAFAAALDDFESNGVSAWVLDLRDNGGGYLDTMSAIAGLLLPKGSPYFVAHTKGGDQISATSTQQHLPARPLSVLVNGGSASASEILSVALQESDRATVVGLKSAGVANAANLDSLPDGGGASITAVQTLTPVKRVPLDGRGVLPDVEVAPDAADIPTGRERQVDTAERAALEKAWAAAPHHAALAVP